MRNYLRNLLICWVSSSIFFVSISKADEESPISEAPAASEVFEAPGNYNTATSSAPSPDATDISSNLDSSLVTGLANTLPPDVLQTILDGELPETIITTTTTDLDETTTSGEVPDTAGLLARSILYGVLVQGGSPAPTAPIDSVLNAIDVILGKGCPAEMPKRYQPLGIYHHCAYSGGTFKNPEDCLCGDTRYDPGPHPTDPRRNKSCTFEGNKWNIVEGLAADDIYFKGMWQITRKNKEIVVDPEKLQPWLYLCSFSWTRVPYDDTKFNVTHQSVEFRKVLPGAELIDFGCSHTGDWSRLVMMPTTTLGERALLHPSPPFQEIARFHFKPSTEDYKQFSFGELLRRSKASDGIKSKYTWYKNCENDKGESGRWLDAAK